MVRATGDWRLVVECAWRECARDLLGQSSLRIGESLRISANLCEDIAVEARNWKAMRATAEMRSGALRTELANHQVSPIGSRLGFASFGERASEQASKMISISISISIPIPSAECVGQSGSGSGSGSDERVGRKQKAASSKLDTS